MSKNFWFLSSCKRRVNSTFSLRRYYILCRWCSTYNTIQILNFLFRYYILQLNLVSRVNICIVKITLAGLPHVQSNFLWRASVTDCVTNGGKVSVRWQPQLPSEPSSSSRTYSFLHLYTSIGRLYIYTHGSQQAVNNNRSRTVLECYSPRAAQFCLFYAISLVQEDIYENNFIHKLI